MRLVGPIASAKVIKHGKLSSLLTAEGTRVRSVEYRISKFYKFCINCLFTIMNDEFLKTSSSKKVVIVENANTSRIESDKNVELHYFANIESKNECISNKDEQWNIESEFSNESSKKQLNIRPKSLLLNTSIQMSTSSTTDDVAASLDEGFSLLSW